MNTESVLYENPSIYNQIYGPFTEDIPFFREMFRRYGGSVCELACGDGRVAIPLAHAGAHVVGIDVSPRMIDAARARTESIDFFCPPEFLVGDMRDDFSSGVSGAVEPFGLVIIPLHSLSHLLTTEDVLRCLRSIHHNLEDDGRLVFAVHNPDPVVLARDPEALFAVDFPGMTGPTAPTIHENTRYDPIRQILHVRWWVDRTDLEATSLSGNEPIKFALRMFFPEELVVLLSAAGFSVERRFGWYDESPLVADSGTQIVIAVPK